MAFGVGHAQSGVDQAGVALQVPGRAVHVTEQDQVLAGRCQTDQIAQLALARTLAQGQMHGEHVQRPGVAAEAQQQRAAPRQKARQLALADAGRRQAAEHRNAMARQRPIVAVHLQVPVRKAGPLGQVLGLIQERAPVGTGVDFLQRHDVVVAQHGGDLVEVFLAPAKRQHMPPAARQVLAIAGGVDADLDVVGQHAQAVFGMVHGVSGRAGCRRCVIQDGVGVAVRKCDCQRAWTAGPSVWHVDA